jgi:hypothetical protein
MASGCPLAKKMSSGRLTQVAKKHQVSRAAVWSMRDLERPTKLACQKLKIKRQQFHSLKQLQLSPASWLGILR